MKKRGVASHEVRKAVQVEIVFGGGGGGGAGGGGGGGEVM